MSDRGQLLELLDDAHSTLGTLQAEYRDWAQPRPSSELIVHSSDPDDMHPRVHWRRAGPFPARVERKVRIWLNTPDQLRVEVHRGNRLVRFGVLNDVGWCRWDAVHGTDASEVPANGEGWWVPPLLAPVLLNPIRLLVSLTVTPGGGGVRAGREVVCAHARPRRHPWSVDSDANREYELEFDAEHGTMLRYAVSENNEPALVTEAIAVRYDVAIDVDRFVFVALDTEPAGSS